MTVFTQVFNLSDNVKYMNYKIDTTPAGGGNALEFTKRSDRKEFMHRFLEMITTDRDNQQIPTNKTLGWQRIDGADSAGAIWEDSSGVDPLNDSSTAVYGFIRAKSYDYSTTGHWKYVRFKLFERNEDNLNINQVDQVNGARYLSGDRVLVMRYDTYADFGVTAEDSAAVVDSINAGINSAEADGYGSTDLDAGFQRGPLYATFNNKIGFSAAYNSNHTYINDAPGWTVNSNNTNYGQIYYHWTYYGQDLYYGTTNTGYSRTYPHPTQNTAIVNSNAIGYYQPYRNTNGFVAHGSGYNFFSSYYGVNGFGDSDLSVKNSYNELKILLDGNGTLWGFGDQDRTGSNTDSASGTNGFKGVNATGADARYLAIFNTQHQDDNPEKWSPYNTILFAGEYKKEFGEPVNSGYLHNGIKFNAHNLLMNNGVATPPNYSWLDNFNWAGNNAHAHTHNPANANTVTFSSFNQNFAGRDANGNAASSNIGGVSGQGITGDNQTTQAAAVNNTTQQRAKSGNWLMGRDLLAGSNVVGAPDNRSRSMGQGSDPEMHWRSKTTGNTSINNSTNNTYGKDTYAGADGFDHNYSWVGFDGAQFALTEYPTRNDTIIDSADAGVTHAQTRESIQTYDNYAAPTSGRAHLSATRMHMGYLGYVGHLNSKTAYSLNELFFGAKHGLFGDGTTEVLGSLSTYEPGTSAGAGHMAQMGSSLPMVSDLVDSANGSSPDAVNQLREYAQEFHPIAGEQSQYSVYEPIISVGTLKMNGGGYLNQTGGYANYTNQAISPPSYTTHNVQNAVMRYGGGYGNSYMWGNEQAGELGQPGDFAKKRSAFALLGRTYGLKIFGPYQHDKYNFLDAVSVQLDDDGFYAVNPNNAVDHWIVPANTDQVSFLFKK